MDPIADIEREHARIADEVASNRDAAFFDVPLEIAGVPVVAMTPLHYAILRAAQDPFLFGFSEEISAAGLPGRIQRFLFVLSPDYPKNERVDSKAFAEARDNFIAKHARLNWDQALDEIFEYICLTFQDNVQGDKSNHNLPVASDLAWLIHTFAKQYGWPASVILNTPLRQLYQLYRFIYREETGHDPVHPADAYRLLKLNEDVLNGNTERGSES